MEPQTLSLNRELRRPLRKGTVYVDIWPYSKDPSSSTGTTASPAKFDSCEAKCRFKRKEFEGDPELNSAALRTAQTRIRQGISNKSAALISDGGGMSVDDWTSFIEVEIVPDEIATLSSLPSFITWTAVVQRGESKSHCTPVTIDDIQRRLAGVGM